MRRIIVCALLLTAAAWSPAEDAPVTARGDDPATQRAQKEEKSPHARCVSRCNAANARCDSEVRRARQECSRRAATGGLDPMTGQRTREPMRDSLTRGGDYAYFCDFFQSTTHCGATSGSGRCEARYQQRFRLCVDAMDDNVMGARHDCQRIERDAQGMCRDELRDCEAACEQE